MHFILEAIKVLGVESYHVNTRGSGSEQYPPAMMQALLVDCYVTGRFGSRSIEEATYSDVAVRYRRAGEMIEQLRLEVDALVKEAEEADAKESDALKLPDEIRRREDRMARLQEAREVIRQRHEEERREKQADEERRVESIKAVKPILKTENNPIQRAVRV